MIITITSYKGGVAKTTSAVHIAAYFHRRKKSVLLVDGDPNRSALSWSKRGALPFPVVDERAAPKHIGKYENIVIDTAARPDRDELAALVDGCDLLLLPCTPDPMAMEALGLTTQALKQLGAESYRVLLTIVPPRPNKDGEEARALLTESGLPLLKAQIRRRIAFQRAALQGCPVYEIRDRGAEAWADYLAVGKELING
jgi:chromosome partitioning protein